MQVHATFKTQPTNQTTQLCFFQVSDTRSLHELTSNFRCKKLVQVPGTRFLYHILERVSPLVSCLAHIITQPNRCSYLTVL